MDFGIIPSSASVWLDYAVEVLLNVVKGEELRECRINWPNAAEMEESSELL